MVTKKVCLCTHTAWWAHSLPAPGSASSVPAVWCSHRFSTTILSDVTVSHLCAHFHASSMLLIPQNSLIHIFSNLNNIANVMSYSPTPRWLRIASPGNSELWDLSISHLAIQPQNSLHMNLESTAFHSFFWTTGVPSIIHTTNKACCLPDMVAIMVAWIRIGYTNCSKLTALSNPI